MDNIDLQDLLSKYRTGTCNAEELALLENWYAQWKVEYPHFSDEELMGVKDEVWQAIANDVKPNSPIKLWPRIIGVAAAVAAIVFGVFFFKAPSNPEPGSGSANYTNDIAPGKNTATLTLANGKTINLSDAKTGVIIDASDLKYNDNTPVISTERSDENRALRELSGAKSLGHANSRDLSYRRDDGAERSLTITTPRGGTYQVRLPDGTKVWLNAASSLTYYAPLIERGGIRKVELSGEAYFEVFRNKNQPFVVTTKNLTTTVLGTHFNISAYEDEGSTKATLLEGSVRVASLAPLGRGGVAEEGNVVLKPNQQAILKDNSINCVQVDANATIDWKNGQFIFNDEPLESIMRKVARWYDVEVIYQNVDKTALFYGSVSRYDQVSKILSKLEVTGGIHFKVEGKKILVFK
ncbi:ferric-dicitrate binding protein FerR (iron transport regulator) [Pedobacter sp. AK017]|uniref:FecR family protein n=1 Tax=Pedobacter sp. AK017 TaxID=2723073 RepID=UPI00160A2D52|nr:FecR family protein [Pedobacter sp. AK017]MBB5438805.1 ferric-dicitrate binding protein FerR (iron transport regulator) [Pedobacter sp. AK017]